MKTKVSILGILIIFSLVLSACGGAPTPAAQSDQPAQAPVADEKTKLVMWLESSEGGEGQNCIADETTVGFAEKFPNIELQMISQANTWDAVRTALAGGGGPDIVLTPGPAFVYLLALADQLYPLDEFVTEYGWNDQFLPWALDAGVVDGKLYSLPNEIETVVLYYNKTVFEENGWTPPTTFEELTDLAEKMKAAGIIPFADGNADWRWRDGILVSTFLNHYPGPQIHYEALTGERTWDDPVIVESMDLLNEYQQNGYFQNGLERYYTTTDNEYFSMFGEGKAAMRLDGTWAIASMSDYFGSEAGNSNDWDWVHFPTQTGEPLFTLGIGSTYSINKNTKNPQAAAQFLNYYFSPENELRLIVACGVAPAPVVMDESILSELDPRRARAISELAAASADNNFGYTTWTFFPPKPNTYLNDEIEKIWGGTITSEKYLQDIQNLFEEDKAEGNVIPVPAH